MSSCKRTDVNLQESAHLGKRIFDCAWELGRIAELVGLRLRRCSRLFLLRVVALLAKAQERVHRVLVRKYSPSRPLTHRHVTARVATPQMHTRDECDLLAFLSRVFTSVGRYSHVSIICTSFCYLEATSCEPLREHDHQQQRAHRAQCVIHAMVRTKSSAALAPKRILRVHAEGAQNIHASDSKFSLDAKPDPYIVFVLGNVTHKCDHVNDVEPLKYFAWPNAVKDFEFASDRSLADLSLVLHVKDSDTLKDRYIGGASIPLGPLLASMRDNVLCQSKLFTLEFADEKLKKRKDSGEVKLTITLIEDVGVTPQPAGPQHPPSDVKAVAPPLEEKAREVTAATSSLVEQPAVQESASIKQPAQNDAESTPAPAKAPAIESPTAAPAAPDRKPRDQITSPPVPDPAPESLQTKLERQKTSSKRELNALEPLPSTASAQDPVTSAAAVSKETSAEPKAPAIETTPPAMTTTLSPPSTIAPALNAPTVVTAMTIELVSAKNLIRPVSLGAMFDRKPDPFVAFEFFGITRATAPLKDADLKKPVVWTNTQVVFDLPPRTAAPAGLRKGVSPMDLVVLVKDENLLKPTFMGGAKLSLGEFFEPPSAGSDEWIASGSATNNVERTIPLTFADEKLSKRKACGELTLRLHFATSTPSAAATAVVLPPTEAPPVDPSVDKREVAAPSVAPAVADAAQSSTEGVGPSLERDASVPIESLASVTPPQLSSDVKLLSVEALCGRNLLRPSAGATPKGLVKALFDRKPDPYVTFVLNGEAKQCAALKDVDVAFFEWRDAVQVFAITHKPYPTELLVLVRDEDTLGKDPFIAGARIALGEIWDAAAQSSSTGDAEVVRAFPLVFADEKLTKQKVCGEITLRFRWVFADAPLPVHEVAPVHTEQVSSSGSDTPMDSADVAGSIELVEAVTSVSRPATTTFVGYVVLRQLVLTDKDTLVDPSLDLYLVVSAFPSAIGPSAKARVSAATSVRTNATKQATSDRKVEWLGETLIVPVVVSSDASVKSVAFELKDKNAITKDTQVAELAVAIQSIAAVPPGDESKSVGLELVLCSAGKAKAKATGEQRTVQFACSVQFLPLGSPRLSSSLSSGTILTLFLVKGQMAISTDDDKRAFAQDTVTFGLNVDYLSNQTKKKGLLSFGSHDVEAQTDHFRLERDLVIEWHTCLDVVYSAKQVAAAKDKDSLDIEVQLLMFAGKKGAKVVGSVQLNLWPMLSIGSTQLATTELRFGESASMTLEFAVASRTSQDDSAGAKAAVASEVSAFKAAVHVPSGNLHVLVRHAQRLVAPTPSDEKAEDLDPEVRLSIEPKYIKRKDNPVRSMLKTRPLENAGVDPVWNEYLRLEYRLPLPPVAAADVPVGKAIEENAAFAQSLRMLPPPVVQVGIYDIEVVRTELSA